MLHCVPHWRAHHTNITRARIQIYPNKSKGATPKQFAHIHIGCGIHSEACCSLNHSLKNLNSPLTFCTAGLRA